MGEDHNGAEFMVRAGVPQLVLNLSKGNLMHQARERELEKASQPQGSW